MHLFWNICCFFTNRISSFYKGWQGLFGKYKKQALAVIFLVLEAISTVLDLFGTSRSSFLVAAFLLSAFGFGMTIYTCFIERTRLRAQSQLRVVEIVFSLVQLLATFVHFIMAILGAKNNYDLSLFPLAFAIIAAVFVFEKNEFEGGLHNNNSWGDQQLQDFTWEDYQGLRDDPGEDYQEQHDDYAWDYEEQWEDYEEQWEDYQELRDDEDYYQEEWDDYQELQDYQLDEPGKMMENYMMSCGGIIMNYTKTRGKIKNYTITRGRIEKYTMMMMKMTSGRINKFFIIRIYVGVKLQPINNEKSSKAL
ncbi:hypothetical protein ACOSP7_003844 [Xanthoceras sorbifolium]